ncbi:MAG: thiomuracin/GE37468 family thiazolyl RiPP peptide [Egibacteraceae bacterium]
MDKLRLDLEALEVERLDVGAPGLGGGLEHIGMGHGATEFGASCGDCYCYCYCSYSCAYCGD